MNQSENKTNPTVSVCMITYNHEKFIKDAIEGVLMQKTVFPIQLIIGEDYSTDNTRAICEEYQKRHPQLIKLLPTEINLGMMPNFIRTLDACKDKYIALCEGDDYWTDATKLQRQVDFLERNRNYAGTAENAVVLNDYGEKHLFGKKPSRDVTIKELIKGRQFATASILFRNNLTIPSYFNEFIAGDTPLMILILQKGPIYYNNTVSSVYRRGAHGVTSTFSDPKNLKRWMINNQRIDEMTEFKYSKYLNSSTIQERNNNHFTTIIKKSLNWLESKSNSVLCKLFKIKQFFYFDLQKLSLFKRWYYLIFK